MNNTTLPERIPLFPLPNAILFPGISLPLHIFEPRYREMAADARAGDGMIGMVLPHAAVDSLAVPGATASGEPEEEIIDLGRFAPELPNFAVDVEVELGRKLIRVRDLLALEVGDTLTFDRLSEAVGSVQGIPKFVGSAGKQSGRKAFRITSKQDGESADA